MLVVRGYPNQRQPLLGKMDPSLATDRQYRIGDRLTRETAMRWPSTVEASRSARIDNRFQHAEGGRMYPIGSNRYKRSTSFLLVC